MSVPELDKGPEGISYLRLKLVFSPSTGRGDYSHPNHRNSVGEGISSKENRVDHLKQENDTR